VSAVSKVFHMKKQGSEGQISNHLLLRPSKPQRTEVDLVCRNGACWIKVKAMSAEGVAAVVNGTATGSRKSVLALADEILEASRYNLVHYKPPTVVFHFSKGVSSAVSGSLTKRGVLVEGDIVETPDDEEFDSDSENDSSSNSSSSISTNDEPVASSSHGSISISSQVGEPEIKIVNLDVTTLITMVSDVTNGGENDEFEDELLKSQAADERLHPTLAELHAFFKGKDVVVTEMAVEKFYGIIRIVGGPKEQERARVLFPPHSNLIRVIPNTPSPLLQSLQAPRVKEQHRAIFGTGHALMATTMTANVSFAATAKERGIFLSLYIHPARALTEQKSIKKSSS
jgi:hypothetical protein